MEGFDERQCVLEWCSPKDACALRAVDTTWRCDVDAWLAVRYDARLEKLMDAMRIRPLPPRRRTKAHLQLLGDKRDDETEGVDRGYVCGQCGRAVSSVASCTVCAATRFPWERVVAGPALIAATVSLVCVGWG